MTIKQLTYLIEIQKTSSFTGAAKNLYVSQGVISQSIKDLERELGFKIFNRTSKKLEITKQGYLVLCEAKKILNTVKNIKTIKRINTINSLKIKTFDFSPILDAFNAFAKKYESTKNTHLSLKISEYNEIISGVLEEECDLGILIFPYDSKYGKGKYLDDDLFEIIPLSIQQIYVKLRQNHPALEKANPLNELKNYKLVHFRNESYYPNTVNEKLFIDSNNSIYINDKEARYKLVSSTNAYMMGMTQSAYYKEKYNLHEIEIDKHMVEIICFHRKNKALSNYTSEFIDLLSHKIASFLKT
jgi:DNA-binding transcriptional LysR family regulator